MIATHDRTVRAAVYSIAIETGRVPSSRALAAHLGRDENDVEASLERLGGAHVLTLAPDSREIRMAHPFSAIETSFSVDANGMRYSANCAWDALGILALLGRDGEASARCGDCGEELTLTVEGGALLPTSTVVHFLVPPVRFYDDIGFT